MVHRIFNICFFYYISFMKHTEIMIPSCNFNLFLYWIKLNKSYQVLSIAKHMHLSNFPFYLDNQNFLFILFFTFCKNKTCAEYFIPVVDRIFFFRFCRWFKGKGEGLSYIFGIPIACRISNYRSVFWISKYLRNHIQF